jgi:membrane associated rhomboid family serine protease
VVARRIGPFRFVVFWLLSALASAALFLVFHWGDQSIMVGASGVVSALMGAAARFAFGDRGGFRRDRAHLNRRLGIAESLTSRTVFGFLVVCSGFWPFRCLIRSGKAKPAITDCKRGFLNLSVMVV